MSYLLVAVCALLLYGSLYPWEFHSGPTLAAAIRHVFSSWPARYDLGELKDILLNLIIYLPVGFAGYLAEGGQHRLRRLVWPGLLGFALSLAVETLQHYCPRRMPSALDLICNTAGAFAGTVVALAFENTLRARWAVLRRSDRLRPSSALMLLLFWAGYFVLPLRPVSFGVALKIRALLRYQGWSWFEFVGGVLVWLTLSQLLHAAVGTRLGQRMLVLAWPVLFFVRLLAPGRTFTWSELFGAGLGVVLSFPLTRWPRLAHVPLALLWIGWIGAAELRPYRFSTFPHGGTIIPFRDMLGSAWMESVLTLLEKCCLYSSAFWCVERAGLRRGWTLAGLTLAVAACEWAQRYLPTRTPSTTDVAVVLLVGTLLWRLELKYGA